MSTALLDLDDRIITDTGSMVAKYELLLQLALSDKPFSHLPFEPNDDVQRYHLRKNTQDQAKMWVANDQVEGPPLTSFDWVTPEPYASIDVQEYCEQCLEHHGCTSDVYLERLIAELDQSNQKGMDNFIRCLIWIIDVMKKNQIVWGLGRGSSCASLIMYLIGVNKVDPVRYDIPMEEFYK